MSDLVVGNRLVPNRPHSGGEVVVLANDAWREGYLHGVHVSGELQHALLRLTSLISEILHIARYTAGEKLLRHHLEQLAIREFNTPSLEELASGIGGRLLALDMVAERLIGTRMSKIAPEIKTDANLVHSALREFFENDDKGEALRSEQIQALNATHYTLPSDLVGGRPAGMSGERIWLAKRILQWEKHRKGAWKVGMAIFNEIRQTPEQERTPEQIYAFNLLRVYMRQDFQEVSDTVGMGSTIRDVKHAYQKMQKRG